MIKLLQISVNLIKIPNNLSMSLICPTSLRRENSINENREILQNIDNQNVKTNLVSLQSEKFTSKKLFDSVSSEHISVLSNGQDKEKEMHGQQCQTSIEEPKTQKLRLPMLLILNKSKRALLKQPFNALKSAAKIYEPLQKTPDYSLISLQNSELSLNQIIQQTLDNGKKQQTNSSLLKQLYQKIFKLQLKNTHDELKIQGLEKYIEDLEKKFMKQTEKKRESLETVAQEIRQKIDLIIQLQHTIKQYQKITGKSVNKLYMDNVLIQDQFDLKKTCLRLENVNEKLNCDLKNANLKIEELKIQVNELKKNNQVLRTENKILKQKNFDLSQQVHQNLESAQTHKNLCRKLSLKIEKIKLSEKKRVDFFKLNSKCLLYSSQDIFGSKNTQASEEDSPFSRKQSLRQLEAQQKLEEMFSYIFNIHEETYRIQNQQLFDEDELNLLKNHKNTYLNNIHNQNPQIQTKGEKIIRNNDLNETDEIFCLKSPKLTQNSFLNALEMKTVPEINSSADKMKLIDLEVEKSRLIQKIADLKKMQMHLRDVFLNFLKTVDFNNFKPETSSILEVIFEFFEYSEQEKASMMKEKKKKFFGIL